MPAAEAGPVTIAEAESLLADFRPLAHVALAVSGGADSTALLFLAWRWRRQLAAGPRLTVLTVDHGLRPSSRAEAEAVERLAVRLELPAVILTWTGTKPTTGLQEAARKARFELLIGAARACGAEAIALAHTADDQAETFLMRLARGSGFDGLSGMAPAVRLEGVWLLRPLLAISHRRLVATLEAEGLGWSEDPSNLVPDFERVRARRVLEALGPLGIEASAIARSASRLGRARGALDALAREAWERLVRVHPEGWLEVDRAAFETLPEELRLRLVERAVRMCGGAEEPPRLSALEALSRWLAAEEGRARTLKGARIVRRKAHLLVGREPGRLAAAPIALRPEGLVWDGRFRLCGGPPGAAVEIVPGHALDDAVLSLAGRRPGEPRFVTDSRPVAMSQGRVLGFAGEEGTGVTAAFPPGEEETWRLRP